MIYSVEGLRKQKSSRSFHTFSEKNMYDSINESKIFNSNKTYDIFLSHSFADKDIIEELVFSLKRDYDFDYSIYIDWIEDPNLERTNVQKETASKLKLRMKNCKSLLYVTSENHSKSKWMPWELGYFDGFRNRVGILPISVKDNDDVIYYGQEYLGLYPYLTEHNGRLVIHDNTELLMEFKNWLK